MCHILQFDRVLCIDNRQIFSESNAMPNLKQVYTVDMVRSVGDGYSVRLVEITPECYKGGPCSCGECGWDAGRFRTIYRLDDSALDVFRAMLSVPVELSPIDASVTVQIRR